MLTVPQDYNEMSPNVIYNGSKYYQQTPTIFTVSHMILTAP